MKDTVRECRQNRIGGYQQPRKALSSRFAILGAIGILYFAFLQNDSAYNSELSARTDKAQPESTVNSRPTDPSVVTVGQQGPLDTIEFVPIALRPLGFEPSEITLTEKRLFFVVSNLSGIADVTFRLDRVGGSRLIAAPVPRNKARWRHVLQLTPGTYVLSEASYPHWTCKITITAK